MTKIAFIGLGNMGSGMCANLVKAGHDVCAFDLNADAVAAAGARGAAPATSIAEAVNGAGIVISMLPAGKHVHAVYFGADGVAAHAPQGALFIDCSTIAVTDARAAHEKAEAAGFMMVDAPVSGGTAAAEAGTLTFMVGGLEVAFATARPALEAMGKNIFHAGGAGNGQAAKIANNMLLGISMIGTCEAFNLAEKLGLDAQTFFDISSVSSGQCTNLFGESDLFRIPTIFKFQSTLGVSYIRYFSLSSDWRMRSTLGLIIALTLSSPAPAPKAFARE